MDRGISLLALAIALNGLAAAPVWAADAPLSSSTSAKTQPRTGEDFAGAKVGQTLREAIAALQAAGYAVASSTRQAATRCGRRPT